MAETAPPSHLPASLVAAIRRARVVSFDIFDTALTRATEKPVDAFILLANDLGMEEVAVFAQGRVAAESEARRLAWESRGAVEVTLAEIYECGFEGGAWLRGRAPGEVMERERALELRLCRRHPVIGAAFDWALSLGKKVGFISDMYLDKVLIAAMLARCGYRSYDFLWVSSAVGTTKASGGLYRHALAQNGNAPADQLHIGDNLDSDIKQAQAAGLAAWFIGKCCDQLPRSPIGRRLVRGGIAPVNPVPPGQRPADDAANIWRTLWRGLAAERQAGASGDFWFSLGYTHVGMLLLGFGLWLARKAEDANVTQLYFLARDGHVMHAVHRMLQERALTRCPGRYLHASRRVFNIPALIEIDEQACDFLVSGTTRMPVRAFLARVGLDVEASTSHIRAAGFSSPEQLVVTGEDYGRLRALFRELGADLLTQAGKERRLLGKYFEQEGVFGQAHVGLVDIGWHGSLQDSFSRLLGLWGYQPGQVDVTGFYLGTFPAAKARVAAGARQHAFLCEGGEPARRFGLIRTSVEVFEWLFCAPHGSVIGFREGDIGIEPELESGHLEKARQTTAAAMQAGALQFVQDALACFPSGARLPPVPPDFASALLADLLQFPSAREACALGDLPHAEGFGDVVTIRPIARPTSRPYNVMSWRDLMDGYRHSFWRNGYKRRLWPDCW